MKAGGKDGKPALPILVNRKMLDKFRLAKFRVDVIAEDELTLPEYKGATIRGAFGYAFKRVACIKSKSQNCNECSLKERCPYNYVFNTPVPKDADIMKKYNYAPHPYVLCPPLEFTHIYSPGSKMHFFATIVGDALNYLPYFVLSFETMGKLGLGKNKGKYKLSSISALSKKGAWKEIYNSANKQLMNSYPILKVSDLESIRSAAHYDKVRNQDNLQSSVFNIQLLTPLRIKYNGEILGERSLDDKHLDFHILVRSLLRRIGLLSYFHCGEELDLNYKKMIETAQSIRVTEKKLDWYDWGRYSQRQGRGIGMGGLIGKVSYEGKIDEFLPFIRLGEFVHVGKSTAFGMGKYVLD